MQQTSSEADWLIGAGLLVEGVALRSLKAPGTAYDNALLGKDPQPARMQDYVETIQDNGGVHLNSGIPNHAFYLCATAIGGYSWEKAGRIWYDTLRHGRLGPKTTFRRFASQTNAQAKKLFGRDSEQQRAVHEAWRQVGIELP